MKSVMHLHAQFGFIGSLRSQAWDGVSNMVKAEERSRIFTLFRPVSRVERSFSVLVQELEMP